MNRINRMDSAFAGGCDAFVSIESSRLLHPAHPAHPVHPVEYSGSDLINRIVAKMNDPERYRHTADAHDGQSVSWSCAPAADSRCRTIETRRGRRGFMLISIRIAHVDDDCAALLLTTDEH